MWIEIDEIGLKNFEHLVPAEELHRIGKDEDYFGIGYSESLDVLPDSVIVFKLDAEQDDDGELIPIVDIRYFAVVEEKWHRGYFKGLLTEFLKLVSKMGVHAIRADIPMDGIYNNACRILEDFGFEFEICDLYEFIESLSRIRRAPLLAAGEEDKEVETLSKLSPGEFKEVLSQLYKSEVLTDEDDISTDLKDYDAEVSTIYRKDGEIKALVLLKGPFGDMLDLVYVGGEAGFEDTYPALRTSMRKAAERYGWNTRIKAQIKSDAGATLLTDIFPDARPIPVRRGYLLPEGADET